MKDGREDHSQEVSDFALHKGKHGQMRARTYPHTGDGEANRNAERKMRKECQDGVE